MAVVASDSAYSYNMLVEISQSTATANYDVQFLVSIRI